MIEWASEARVPLTRTQFIAKTQWTLFKPCAGDYMLSRNISLPSDSVFIQLRRPTEIRAQDDPDRVDLLRLVLLADIAHKYECKCLENWANDVIRAHWNGDQNAMPQSTSKQSLWALDILEKLLILIIKTDSMEPTFKKEVETLWLSRAFANSNTSLELRRALDFADTLKSPRHQGLAYYHALRRVGVLSTENRKTFNVSQIAVSGPTNSKDLVRSLSSEQQLKLMSGLWSLDALRCQSLADMSFDRSPQCYTSSLHGNCQGSWKMFWSNLKGFHDFGRMLEVALERAGGRNEWGINSPCRSSLKPMIEDMLRKFEENLPMYFSPFVDSCEFAA